MPQVTAWTCDWHLKLGWGQSCRTKPFACGIHHILVDKWEGELELQDAQLVSGELEGIPCWQSPITPGHRSVGLGVRFWPQIRLSFPLAPAGAPAYLRAARYHHPYPREVAHLTDACRWPTETHFRPQFERLSHQICSRALPQE